MKTLEEIILDWPLRHHSYGISARNISLEYLTELFESKQTSYIYAQKYHQLTIENVRELRNLQLERSSEPKIFIVQCSVIYQEAQNALLKVLEEPGLNTVVILIYPSIHSLLPTLQSRIEEISISPLGQTTTTEILEVDKFLQASLSERYTTIKNFLGSDSDELELGTYHHEARNFLDALEVAIKARENNSQNLAILEVILKAKQYLSQQGSSVKMILDLVATRLEKFNK
jgi:DNA polymerase III delta prime subunit